ncbi:MAG: DUF3667 domain-containing protein [Flavobacteriaceae bacterium]|nr:DUF3667 domain-containing protein [Flavobacteriaceae bacterium]
MLCKNCKTKLKSDANYCNKCGAKIIRNRLTLKLLLKSFSHQFLKYDNKFLQTFIYLFSKPEDVIGGYIDGTREKYVNVIRYFAIALTISGVQILIFSRFFPDLYNLSSISFEGQEEISNNNLIITSNYKSIIMMLYAPLYALMSRIVFLKNKKFNYAEHLVIFMYILAQTTITSSFITLIDAFFGVSFGTSAIVMFVFHFIYSSYCLKRLFNLSFKRIILKTILFLLVLLGFIILFSVIYLVIMTLVYGSFQEFSNAVTDVN